MAIRTKVWCVAGTFLFCLGNMVSTVVQRRGVPLGETLTRKPVMAGEDVLRQVALARGEPASFEGGARAVMATLGDLCQRTADELLEAKNFGQTSLTEVRRTASISARKC